MAGQIVAKLLTPIPMPAQDVLVNAPVRWRLGGVEMATPLFSPYRYKLFIDAVHLMPIVMLSSKAVPFWEIVDLEGDNEKIASDIRALFRRWVDADFWDEYIPDLAALIIAVSDPVDKGSALRVIENWEIETGCDLPIQPDDRTTLVGIRQLIYEWSLHVLTFDDLALLVDNLRQINIEIKKKLLNRGQVGTPEKLHRKKLYQAIWKKG